MKKGIVGKVLLVLAMAFMLVGCGDSTEEKGSVYYLNFKPEVASVWEEIAQVYTEETGVEVKINTAASGNYEKILQSEVAKREIPTLFQINGPIGYKEWQEFCLDLSDTDLYAHLLDKNLAITVDGGVYGIPYVVEGYGIIYNDAIMKKYFALPDKAVAISSADEITSFELLKAVAEDMTLHKEQLGIKGVFASTSMAAGEDWRWQTHTANLPVYYEYQDKGVTDLAEIEFTYSDNMKNIMDLYLNNSCVEPALTGSKTVSDSMAEFALGKVAMVQNGNWAWGQIAGVEGNTVAEEDVKFMPIYTGVAGEETQGLCIGTENFFAINSQASEADQKAAIDFVNWLVSSATGKDYMVNKLGNTAPFTTFTDDEKPTDPLAKSMLASMESGKTAVAWSFTTFPSQTFKDNYGAALLEYANGNMTWDDVKALVVEEWAVEKAAIAE